MEGDFEISSEQRQVKVPVTVLHIHGWLDGQSEDRLLEAARDVYESGTRFLLIDMKELKTLTSAGMRALQKVYRMYTPKEDRFKDPYVRVCQAPPQIYDILGITGFLQNIPVHKDIDSALEAFGKD
ncbi:MAG: STAS domain-containing protein [Anaerolineales bacterium]|nr:STAS domain-containing protein [Anaerolineales bacterium]